MEEIKKDIKEKIAELNDRILNDILIYEGFELEIMNNVIQFLENILNKLNR